MAGVSFRNTPHFVLLLFPNFQFGKCQLNLKLKADTLYINKKHIHFNLHTRIYISFKVNVTSVKHLTHTKEIGQRQDRLIESKI